MQVAARRRAGACHTALTGLIALSVSCTSCEGEGAARKDAATAMQDGAAPMLDAESPGEDASDERDAATSEGMDAASDAAAPSDANAAGEGGAAEAGVDAGPPTLRAQVCGDGGNWPAPLPAQTNQRVAQPVGTQSFGFLEGPVWIAEQGVLLFSDMDFGGDDAQGPPARIRRLRPPSSYDVFAEASNSNGLALTKDGALLAATHDNQGLSLFQLTNSARTPLTVRSGGKRFNSPNDLTVRSDGTVYFTDPDWQLGPRTSETMIMGVYRLTPPLMSSGTNAAVAIEDTLNKPNGIALSPDERTLYVGSLGNEVWKYQVATDGSTSGRTMFANTGGGSDGMAVDCAGNVYVTSGRVQVFAPNGDKLGEITLDGEPTNAAFGGADRRTLYITAGPRLYSIQLNVPGFPY